MYETYDVNGDLSSIELEFDSANGSHVGDSDSGMSSPDSPSSPPVEIEFSLEGVSGSSDWESDLFGQALPAVSKMLDILESCSTTSLTSASIDLLLDDSHPSSLSASSLLAPESSFADDVAVSPKGKRKQPASKSAQKNRTKKGKNGVTDDITPTTAATTATIPSPTLVLSDAESSSDSASAESPSAQKRRTSPTKRRGHYQIFKSEQVLKISSKVTQEEEEDVDID